MAQAKKRDSWGTRLGIIMAVAGSAVGLGNFRRMGIFDYILGHNFRTYRVLFYKSIL